MALEIVLGKATLYCIHLCSSDGDNISVFTKGNIHSVVLDCFKHFISLHTEEGV